MSRNNEIELAVNAVLSRIDDFLNGEKVQLPKPSHRRAIESLLLNQKNSVTLATLFLLYYWIENPDWDLKSVPVGIRGKYGDKRLSEELTKRNITLHQAIVSFGENLGWKGNVRNVNLENDPRFWIFFNEIKDSSREERKKVADYLAQEYADSRKVAAPLPPVGPNVLTFARAKALLSSLVNIQSEGHIPQFIIASLLRVHRQRYGIEVLTHHPHAADKFDRTAGDIEEMIDGDLIRAYEVTVRPDWQNRISNFKDKMDQYGLKKYVIIASGVNSDPQWSEPANLLVKLEEYGRDIAVIDIFDVMNVFASELTADELRSAINLGYDMICNPKLCGRDDVKTSYRTAVQCWLDDL